MTYLKRVLIVGGGIGGMAAAIRLREAGVDVDLIDLDPEWKVYGAGITMTGLTLRAYRHLGLIEEIKQQGAITDGSRIFRYDGVLLQDLDEPALESELPATGGIMRPALHRIMQGRVKDLHVAVQLGLTVDRLANRDGGVDVMFSDGRSARYDLVIGADSIYSKVRTLAFPHMSKPEFTGQGCWRISMARPPAMERGEFYFGLDTPAGITACAPDTVYLWLLTADDRNERIPDAEMKDRLRAHLAPFGGNVAWMRDHMTTETWINYRPLEAAIQPPPWHVGRIVLLGDAAHATTPHLASGAGMAVEDALVLSDELARATAVEQGLTAYTARRFERCRDVVETSVAIGKLQLGHGAPEEIGSLMGGALYRLAAPF